MEKRDVNILNSGHLLNRIKDFVDKVNNSFNSMTFSTSVGSPLIISVTKRSLLREEITVRRGIER